MTKPIALVGEAWGAHEEKLKTAFVGASGIELLQQLDEAGIISLTKEDNDFIYKFWDSGDPNMIDMVWHMHPEVARFNVFNLHPHANKIETLCVGKKQAKEEGLSIITDYPALVKGKFVLEEYRPHIDKLSEDLYNLDPNLVVCLGNTPLWALAGRTGVGKIRGTTIVSTHGITGLKLLPTYHPAAVLRQYELRPITVVDLQKAKREAPFPEIRRPKRLIWTEPGIEDIRKFIHEYIVSPEGNVRCECLSVDIETAGTQITMVGLAPSKDLAIVIPFVDDRAKGRSYWPTASLERQAWELIGGVLRNPRVGKVYQNGLYDIAFKLRTMGIPTFGATHDTMLLHHALQPESLKGLGFLGSIYCDEGPWKDERKGTSTIKRDE